MDDIQIDLNRLTYGEYQQFIAAGAAADTVGLLMQVVVAWGFKGDPSERASYEALGVLDLLKVQAALRTAIQGAMGKADQGN